MTRTRLPNRRSHDVFAFVCEGTAYRGGVGLDAQGSPVEVFLDPQVRSGTTLDVLTNDLAVAASLALQHGCPVETLRSALVKLSDETPAGPLGLLLDCVAVKP